MEPIFIFIILMFLGGMGAWYFYGTRTPKPTPPPQPTPQPTKEFKYNVIDRVSKPIPFSWTRERFGCETPHNDFELKLRCNKKIQDLEKLLTRHGKDGFSLSPQDILRYNAMIEVLKAMIN